VRRSSPRPTSVRCSRGWILGRCAIPEGTEADYFNWHTGRPTNGSSSYSFTLADLQQAYRATGAPPIFDLNVLKPANRLNSGDQVAMLGAARHLGLPVKYVEIGNELYGGGAFQSAFPSGAVYGKTVAAYVTVLHRDFPVVKVAADAVTTALLVNLSGSAQYAPVSADVPDGVRYQPVSGSRLRLTAYSITLVSTTG
jgi:hypothetical protein